MFLYPGESEIDTVVLIALISDSPLPFLHGLFFLFFSIAPFPILTFLFPILFRRERGEHKTPTSLDSQTPSSRESKWFFSFLVISFVEDLLRRSLVDLKLELCPSDRCKGELLFPVSFKARKGVGSRGSSSRALQSPTQPRDSTDGAAHLNPFTPSLKSRHNEMC